MCIRDSLWADKKLRVGLAGPGGGGGTAWRLCVGNDLRQKSKEWDIVLYHYSDVTSQEQIYSMKKFIEYDMDIIALFTYQYYTDYYSESSWDEALEVVREAGIPVILVDRRICCEDKSLWKTLIINDYYKQGQMAGEWLIDNLEKGERIDKEIKIACLLYTSRCV